MFKKVLIANRGACASRIIRTLKKMHITAVAVYAQADRQSLHVQSADEVYYLGDGGAKDTYLDIDKIIRIAKEACVQAIHPGYGFLSENADFVKQVEAQGLVFIGPTCEQISIFGLKHKAREIAIATGVPLSPGSGLLIDVKQAKREAKRIGYPLMLKSTAGGGGIGMKLCWEEQDLVSGFQSIKKLSANNFSNDGIYLEKYIEHARHIEVQMIGDGKGHALALGERDCSSQRRNQKVVEECPAPNLTDKQRQSIYEIAERLFSRVNYRSAGTVEFIYDLDSKEFYFLEVNTRLQVEHGVTEMVYGVDLVKIMLQVASDQCPDLNQQRQQLKAQGHAIQARIYAEDPYKNFMPSAGLLSEVYFPQSESIRVDTWIEAGIEVSAFFDPMLAKIIVHEDSRDKALTCLDQALQQTMIYGIETNIDYLKKLIQEPMLKKGCITTRHLNKFCYEPYARIDVLKSGTMTTIQDGAGRRGYWDIGVPPSGAFDNYSFRLANCLLGNDAETAGLEITLNGPHLKFSFATQIVLAGGEIEAQLDETKLENWRVISVKAGQTLRLGKVKQGCRSYVALQGGIDCPSYLGSQATFSIGKLGGHNGRALRAGDVLHGISTIRRVKEDLCIPKALIPKIGNQWTLRVVYGPHGAPDYFTENDIRVLFDSEWEVHYNSNRAGVRLIGPKPQWARTDGEEAGLHPSNIHDNAYAFGSINLTGDVPIILGPDGPSLGGFVCSATVITADLWQVGQLKTGDKVKLHPVSIEQAVAIEACQRQLFSQLPPKQPAVRHLSAELSTPILMQLSAEQVGEKVLYRAAGDQFLLVEYGHRQLNIHYRLRIHYLMQWLNQHPLKGVLELTPGIRSLQIHFDSQLLSHHKLLDHLYKAELDLAKRADNELVSSRVVYLPMSWDDESCRKAIEKYSKTIRENAPWVPSNLEFTRRINGLKSIEAVKEVIFNATYLVAGLGDVYLGAPLAIPIDPRHRLVTTKYNPVRTFTPESAVGIGGAYLCVYGIEGPGGYQLIGRTVSMWNHYRRVGDFDQPWLLRFLDQVRFYEVSHEELLDFRQKFLNGQVRLRIEDSAFDMANYGKLLQKNADSIAAFQQQRKAAFAAELAHWHKTGQFNFAELEEQIQDEEVINVAEDETAVQSPVAGSVWKVEVAIDQRVVKGETLLILESMKMETPIMADKGGIVARILSKPGQRVQAGQTVVILKK